MSRFDPDELRPREHPIHEHIALQARSWRFERCLWGVLGIVVVLAVGGLFSSGPLSDRTVSTADGHLSVTYQRFALNGGASDLTVTARADEHGEVVLWMDGAFYANFTVETLSPAPIESRSRGEGVELRFKAPPDGDAMLYFSIRATGLGRVYSTIGSPGRASVVVNQFVYP